MAVRLREGSALRSISLTPLIDIVFLLVIFLILHFRAEQHTIQQSRGQEERELQVQLPSAETAEPMVVQPNELFINIDENGRFFAPSQPVSIADVERLLRLKVAQNPGQSVVIRADKRVAYEAVVAVMDACNKAGVTNYTTTTAAE